MEHTPHEPRSALTTYLDVLRSRWWVVVLGPVVGFAVALGVTVGTTPTYEAEARVFVNIPAAQGIQEALQGVQLSAQLMASYQELVESRTASDAIARRPDVDLSAAEINRSVSATLETPALIIRIRARSEDPEQAQIVADAAAAELQDIIGDLETGRENPIEGRIVETARVPTSPSEPRPVANILFGLLIGLGAGIGLAVLWHALDTRVRSVEETERLAAAPVLVDVPLARDMDPASVFAPNSPLSENYRSLRTSLRFAALGTPVRTLVITSPASGEGKTTTAVNFATACARAGERVVLVDCDLRRPTLHERLGGDAAPGLAELLTGERDRKEVVRTAEANLRVITAGSAATNPAELLGSTAMRDLLADLSANSTLVILDTPPVCAVTDAVLLSAFCDAVCLVVQWGRTRRRDLVTAERKLSAVGARTIGCVINKDRSSTNRAYLYSPV